MTTPEVYPYKPRAGMSYLGLVFFALCLVVIINDLPPTPTTRDWLLLALGVAFVLMSVALIVISVLSKAHLTLDAERLVLPVGRRSTVIPLDSISRVSERSAYFNRHLFILHGGTAASIVAFNLPSGAVYKRVKARLEAAAHSNS